MFTKVTKASLVAGQSLSQPSPSLMFIEIFQDADIPEYSDGLEDVLVCIEVSKQISDADLTVRHQNFC